MNVGLALVIAQLLPGLIHAAETLFGAATGHGAAKKDVVLAAVKVLIDGAKVLDPALPEPELMAVASTTIDELVSIYNLIGAFKK